MANHCATAHATKQAREEVSATLSDTFAVSLAACFGDFIDQLQCHQGLDDTNHGNDKGGLKDEHPVVTPDDTAWPRGHGKAATQGAVTTTVFEHIFNRPCIRPEVGDEADHDNSHQCGRHRFGEFWEKLNDGHGQHNQADEDAEFTSLHPLHDTATVFIEMGKFLKEAELPHANDNGKAIDETNHHRMGN